MVLRILARYNNIWHHDLFFFKVLVQDVWFYIRESLFTPDLHNFTAVVQYTDILHIRSNSFSESWFY